MKKTFLTICFFFSAGSLLSNPVYLLPACISEFKTGPNNSWIIEIGFNYRGAYYKGDYDSIFVETSSGISRLRLDYIPDSTSLWVITSDSLITPLSVNPSGDCVKLISYLAIYFTPHGEVDSLSYGDYPAAMFPAIPSGYSICKLNRILFCEDKTPTIGSPNDTCGTCGTLTGFMYDRDYKSVLSGDFRVYFPIVFAPDGRYSTRVYATTFSTNMIVEVNDQGGQSIRIDDISAFVSPDTVVVRDIHFTDVVGVKEKNPGVHFSPGIMNYPNPFNSTTNFVVTLPGDRKYAGARIEICNSIGQRIAVIRVPNGSTYRWEGKDDAGKSMPSGLYLYRLILDGKTCGKGSMILLK